MKILTNISKIWDSENIRQKQIWHLALLILFGTAIYYNSLNVPLIFDDHYSLRFIGNKSFGEHILRGGARRFTDITFVFNYRIHDVHVMGYHVINLIIHLSSSVLVYFVARSILTALRKSYTTTNYDIEEKALIEQFIPLTCAMLFVSHPVQTQAVTYIIQRYTTMATLFYLLTTLCYVKARLAHEKHGHRLNTMFLWGGVLIAGVLALGSKQIAVTLPAMLILMELLIFRGKLINRKFFIASGLICAIGLIFVVAKWHNNSLDFLLYDLHHATSEDHYTPRTTYLFTQLRVVATYLRLLCLPVGQNLLPQSPRYTSLLSLPVVLSLSLHIFILVSASIFLAVSERNLLSPDWLRGAFQRLAAVGIYWFYLTMAIESSIFPIQDVIFEHRIYLPSVGFFMTIAAIAALVVQSRRKLMKPAWAFLIIICAISGYLTIARNNVWSDSLLLWQDTAKKSPDHYLALSSLGGEYMDRHMPEKALPLFIRAMELNPNLFIRTKVYIGDALKEMHLYDSRFTTGEEYIVEGGPAGSGDLDYKNLLKWDGAILNNMGLAYEHLNEPAKVMKSYRLSVTTNPEYDLAWFNMALLAAQQGNAQLFNESLLRLQILNPTKATMLASVKR
jgi:hypothetical protein